MRFCRRGAKPDAPLRRDSSRRRDVRLRADRAAGEADRAAGRGAEARAGHQRVAGGAGIDGRVALQVDGARAGRAVLRPAERIPRHCRRAARPAHAEGGAVNKPNVSESIYFLARRLP